MLPLDFSLALNVYTHIHDQETNNWLFIQYALTFELSVSSAGHLFHKFGISESDWYRIKQSIDSKCRTAWRRKQRGQSLAVKSFSKRTPRNSGGGKVQICLILYYVYA